MPYLYPAASKSPRPGILFCRGGERARGNVYEINPNYGHNNDMIRPMDGNTVLFFTEADVVAMAKDNVTTRNKLSRDVSGEAL